MNDFYILDDEVHIISNDGGTDDLPVNTDVKSDVNMCTPSLFRHNTDQLQLLLLLISHITVLTPATEMDTHQKLLIFSLNVPQVSYNKKQ